MWGGIDLHRSHKIMTNPTISLMTHKALTYRKLRQIGPAKLRALVISRCLDKLELGSDEATGVPAVDKALAEPGAWRKAQEDAVRQIEAAHSIGARILSVLDSDFPSELARSSDNPFLIYVQGCLPDADRPAIAVIGTREPTRHGQIIAARITKYLQEHQRSVLSGLAIGCDTVAHETCLRAGGHTIAVLAHGLHTIAPAANRGLAEDILASGGALVSEYEFGVEPSAPQFVRRDLTQAGLSTGVIMIQSDLKGGSLHASRAALKYGKWLAVPYPTIADRNAAAPKIRANLQIADGSPGERQELLACSIADLARIRILRSQEDYGALL